MAATNSATTISKFWIINDPVASSAPITIHTLIYPSPQGLSSTQSTPTIISLHYWGGSASTLRHVPKLLCSKHPTHATPTIISISFRGWGQSSPATPDLASAYSIDVLASDVVKLLPLFSASGLLPTNSFILCGHSMGGKVALAISQLLDKSAPRLRGMLLLAPAPPSPLILPDEIRQQQLQAYDSAASAEWAMRNVLTSGNGERLYGGEDDAQMIVRDSLSSGQGAKNGWLDVGMADCIAIRRADEALAAVKVRILVSEDDRVETVERVTQYTYVRLEEKGYPVSMRVLRTADGKIGHLLPVEAPAEIAVELVCLVEDIR